MKTEEIREWLAIAVIVHMMITLIFTVINAANSGFFSLERVILAAITIYLYGLPFTVIIGVANVILLKKWQIFSTTTALCCGSLSGAFINTLVVNTWSIKYPLLGAVAGWLFWFLGRQWEHLKR